MTGGITGGEGIAALRGQAPVPPPGWARPTDRLLARVRAREIDEKLLNGGAINGSAVIAVRRARLLSRRYRSAVARALRNLVDAARRQRPSHFGARLPLKAREILKSEQLILTLADELETEAQVSARGVILADHLVRDGDSPVYLPEPVSRTLDHDVASAVRHARAALHLG